MKKKINKDNSRKKKTIRGNTVAIHSVLKKKTKKLNSQPTQY
jgi:ribosomal protein S6E (S10)